MKGYDDWKLSSPDEGVEVFTTDEFNYTSEILANVEAFDETLTIARSLGYDEETLEDFAEGWAKELGLK